MFFMMMIIFSVDITGTQLIFRDKKSSADYILCIKLSNAHSQNSQLAETVLTV